MTLAVVVGGASGIGAAVADQQRAQGLDVLVWDVGADADIRCDITDSRQVAAATSATLERAGAPELVTITAGIGHTGSLIDTDAAEWDRVVGTNAKGVWLVMRSLSHRCSSTAARSWRRAASARSWPIRRWASTAHRRRRSTC